MEIIRSSGLARLIEHDVKQGLKETFEAARRPVPGHYTEPASSHAGHPGHE